MRRGIFGGCFDPIHYAHLLLAESAFEKMKLNCVDFVPIGTPPHLKHLRTSGEDRYTMTLRAISLYPEFSVSRCELDRPSTSYTVDTLRLFRKRFPNDELFLIVSSETFNDMPNWKSPGEICELASLVVAQRAGYPPPDYDAFLAFSSAERIEQFKKQTVKTPLVELSSTYIRKRVERGESIRFLTPDPVIDYILENKLYSTP